jgi:hypothetical protein
MSAYNPGRAVPPRRLTFGERELHTQFQTNGCHPEGWRYISKTGEVRDRGHPLPPYYAHQYQNKRVRSGHFCINVKTKDLADY